MAANGGSCAVQSPIGCAIPPGLPRLLLSHLQRASNGLVKSSDPLVKNNALSVKNVRVGDSPKRWRRVAKAIQNRVARRARVPSSAVRDNLERHPPVVLPLVAVRVDLRLHVEAAMPINNNSRRRVSINRRHVSALSKDRRAETPVVLPAADGGSQVAKAVQVKGALARVAPHKAALAGSPVARRHRSAKHSATNALSD